MNWLAPHPSPWRLPFDEGTRAVVYRMTAPVVVLLALEVA